MLPAVITVFFLCVMLLVVVNLIFSSWRKRKRSQLAPATEKQNVSDPTNSRVTVVLQMLDSVAIGGEAPGALVPLSPSWYTRRRTLVSLGLLLMLLVALFVQGGFAGGTLQDLSKGFGFNFLSYSQPTDIHPASHPLPDTASVRLVQLDSAARNQYNNDYEWHVWSYSSCSGFAMVMVMNAYGRHLIVGDVLEEELKLGVWNVQMGLLRDEGISLTAAYFGFNADLSHARTLDELILLSNKGSPIIVSVRDNYYFPGGHLFVVRGGDSQSVYIADSSPANFTRMTHAMFLGMWTGFSAILTPR